MLYCILCIIFIKIVMYMLYNKVEKINRRNNGLCDICLNMYLKVKSNFNKNWEEKIFRVDIFLIYNFDIEF